MVNKKEVEMKNLKNLSLMWVLVLLVWALSGLFQAQAAGAKAEKVFHAIEMWIFGT